MEQPAATHRGGESHAPDHVCHINVTALRVDAVAVTHMFLRSLLPHSAVVLDPWQRSDDLSDAPSAQSA
jgi:hypothetical protein